MLSLLAFFTGIVLTEAGSTHPLNTGFGQRYHLANQPRQVLIKTELANPLQFNPTLPNHGLAFPRTFMPSPTLFNSPPFRQAEIGPLSSFRTSPSFHAAPIRYGAIGPATITHMSPSVGLRTASIGFFPASSVLPQGVLNSGLINPSPIPPPPLAVFSPSPINHAVIGPSSANIQQTLNPSTHNFKITNEDQVSQKVPEKSVSYSITKNDYQYLHRHKIEGLDSPYNPIPGFNTASPNEKHQHTNPHSNHNIAKNGYSHKVSNAGTVMKRSPAPSEAYQGFAEPCFENVPEPEVFKHIYFYVPQQQFEEPPPTPIILLPPKKIYNIVFIKAPAQGQQNSDYLQKVQSRQPLIEDKTLIYVLSKKEDPVQVIPSTDTKKPSSPEVFFVKYQTKLEDITEVRNEIVEERFPENISAHSQTQSLEDIHVVP